MVLKTFFLVMPSIAWGSLVAFWGKGEWAHRLAAAKRKSALAELAQEFALNTRRFPHMLNVMLKPFGIEVVWIDGKNVLHPRRRVRWRFAGGVHEDTTPDEPPFDERTANRTVDDTPGGTEWMDFSPPQHDL